MTTTNPCTAIEIHLHCGGVVVLDHEVWRCRKCRKAPIAVHETETQSEEHEES